MWKRPFGRHKIFNLFPSSWLRSTTFHSSLVQSFTLITRDWKREQKWREINSRLFHSIKQVPVFKVTREQKWWEKEWSVHVIHSISWILRWKHEWLTFHSLHSFHYIRNISLTINSWFYYKWNKPTRTLFISLHSSFPHIGCWIKMEQDIHVISWFVLFSFSLHSFPFPRCGEIE